VPKLFLVRFAARYLWLPLWAFVVGAALLLPRFLPQPAGELVLGALILGVLLLAGQKHRALRRSERSYKELIERLPLVTYVDELNEASTTIYMSPQVEQLLGYPVRFWYDDPEFFPKVLHPEDRDRVLADYPVAIPDGEPYRAEYRLVANDGSVVWVQDEAVIGLDRNGEECLQGFLLDITRRKASEADRQRLAAVVTSADDGVVSTNLEGVIQTWNPGAELIYGCPAEDAVGTKISRFTPPELRDEQAELFAALRAGERVTGYETVRLRKDGTRFDAALSLSPIRDDNGEVVGFSGIVRDITEQKDAERRLEAEHAVTRVSAEAHTLEEGAPRILEALCKCVGWAFGELWRVDEGAGELGCVGVWHDRDSDSLAEFAELARGSRFRRGEGLPGRTWDRQEPMWIRDVGVESLPRSAAASKVGLRAAVGFPIVAREKSLGVVSFFTHELREPNQALHEMMEAITAHLGQFMERIRAEEDRKQLEEQLRHSQKMEAVGRLAGGVAHDFNNSLMAIRGYSELMLARLLPGDPLHRHADGIKKAADSAATMTKQLLAFGRKQMLQPELLDLNEVLFGLSEVIERMVGEDVELLTRAADDLGTVRADPQQIQQVLLNLIVNARDAMPEGGRLTFETANVELEAGGPNEGRAGSHVMLAVTDTGCGMDEETQAQIFEPFFTTKELGKGSGLGLATVYGILEQSDGRISVDSAPGQGTTFRIYLPRSDRPRYTESSTYLFPGVQQGSETVLVVEDEDSVRAVVGHMLEERGYDVIQAAGPDEAIRLAASHSGRIDLLLTDVVMPEMSGAELAVRLADARPELKVLYMSGYTNEAVVHRGVLEDAISFLQKPFTSETLGQRVREVLDGDPEPDAAVVEA
jgi:two-component system cell cycle sensor histidine kinase/response regulator CckA